jgi:hypothetical protein
MTDEQSFRTAAVVFGAAMLATACGSTDHGIAVLDSESTAQPVPEVIETNEQFVPDSARYLGEIEGYSYFAARPATSGEHEACLVQVGSTEDDWVGGCSTIQQDKVVVLSSGVPQQEVALVADNPSTDTLEDAGREKRADNLWQRTN